MKGGESMEEKKTQYMDTVKKAFEIAYKINGATEDTTLTEIIIKDASMILLHWINDDKYNSTNNKDVELLFNKMKRSGLFVIESESDFY